MEKFEKDILSAINSANIQDSQDFGHTILTGTNEGLYNKDPLRSDLTQTGTAVVSQNTVAVRDTSRVKEASDLLELDWNYKSTTSKPFIVKTGVWSSSESVGTNLTLFNFPIDYFNTNHVLNQVGQTFLSFRGDLHFIVTLLGSPFATGALAARVFYGKRIPPSDYNAIYFQPHVILDASDNTTTVDFVVPFKWFRNSCSPFDNIATIYLTVIEPLAGLTTANYTVTCFLENQEFRFLRPTEESSFRTTQGLINITNISNTLENVMEANLPMEMQGDQFDTQLGMDDVGINLNPEAYLVKFNSLNNSSNPHTVEKVSLKAKTLQPSTYDTFNTKVDEMTIAHLFQEREHYFKKFDLSTTTASGIQLMNMAVCPNPSTIANPSPAFVNVAEYVTSYAKFWRGGMKIKLRFFMNRFQSAKIYLGLFYKAITPTVFTDWSSSHGVILDIGGDQREVVVEIPYNAETPWLQVLHNSTDVSLPGIPELTIFDYIMGQFTVYALTPLVTPAGSPTKITCHVTYSCTDDFELAGYSTNNRVIQGMDTTVMLSKVSERTKDYITDTIVSMKDILKKYQMVWSPHNKKLESDYTAFFMSPDWLFESQSPPITGSLIIGNTEFIAPETSPYMYGIYPFTGYRGGVKLRFDLDLYSIQPDQGKVPWEPYYTPYLFYINPDYILQQNGQIDWSVILNDLDKCLVAYFDATAETLPVVTPFEVLPINNVDQINARIFEVEVPWQRNTKFHRVSIGNSVLNQNFSKNFGFVMLVLKKRHPDSQGLCMADLRVFAKIADDGRFGIAEYGNSSLNPGDGVRPMWGGPAAI